MKRHVPRKIGQQTFQPTGLLWEQFENATLEEIRDVAARLCRDYLTGKWKVVKPEQLVVKRVSGGLSNYLYYISLPEDDATAARLDIAAGSCTGAGGAGGAGGLLNSTTLETGEFGNGDFNLEKRPRFECGGASSQQQLQLRCPSKEPREVLLRIYGQTHGGDALESMITETVVFALLSERNFGPKLHGIFPGGRIEQFIQARCLLTRELADPKLSVRIAQKMAEIHGLNIPMSKEPDWLWNCMSRWMLSFDSIMNNNDWSAHEELVRIVRSFDYTEEMKWLKSVIDLGNYKVCFCHNDLQEGNVLQKTDQQPFRTTHDPINSLRSNLENSAIASSDNETDSEQMTPSSKNNNNNNNVPEGATSDNNNVGESEPELVIIDFEYCAYNFRGFDLANHFIEWSIDYSHPEFPYFAHNKEHYPQKQQRQVFIEAYLRKLNENNADYAPTPEEIDGIEHEVRIFSMFSHIFWSMWSVVNATSNFDFGYWEYAVARLMEFKKLKDDYMAKHIAIAIANR